MIDCTAIAAGKKEAGWPEERAPNEPGQRNNWTEATEMKRITQQGWQASGGPVPGKGFAIRMAGREEGVWREENASEGEKEGRASRKQ